MFDRGFRNVLLAVMVVSAVSACERAVADEAAMARGRQLTKMFFDRDFEALLQQFGPQMAAVMKLQTLNTFRDQVEAQVGAETHLQDESVTPQDSFQVYRRLSMFEKAPMAIETTWTLSPSGKVAGFSIRPPQKEYPSAYLDYRTKTALRLPFEGEWRVFWGGRTLSQNHHAAIRAQRFAYDLARWQDGTTHRGDGKRNEDFYAFGQTIVAPGDGVIAVAVDGIPDNVVGKNNTQQIAGNHVVIDHGNNEFSFLAHFQQGSIMVKKGDAVQAGQKLGLCGNSGNSDQPHLHYHLANAADLVDADGLPVQFQNYVADGKPVERGEPVQGQLLGVSPAATGAR
jgi:murein DD-endopeptidase MepM/ murein hydrolase activator NlpD